MALPARWFLVVLTALSVARAAAVCGQVVCTSESGHCEVEAPHRPGHCPDRDADGHDQAPCEDRPAAGGLALQAPHRPVLKGDSIDVAHFAPPATLPALLHPLADAPSPAPPTPPGGPGHFRTVVLLI